MKLTLKEFFAGFLRTRHIARHFRRLALLETLSDTTVSREVPPTLANTLVDAAHCDSGVLLSNLGTHTDGLTDFEVDVLRAQHGLNKSNTSNRCRGGPTCGTATRTRSTCC